MQISGQKKFRRGKVESVPVDAAAPTAAPAAAPAAAAATPSTTSAPMERPRYATSGIPRFVDPYTGKPQGPRDYTSQPPPRPVPAEMFTADACRAAVAARMVGGAEEDAVNYKPVHRDNDGTGNVKVMEPELAAAATVDMALLSTEQGVATLRAVLDALGFAIVANVLTKKECEQVETLFGHDLLSIIDVERSSNLEKIARIAEDPVHRWPLEDLPLGAKSVSDYGLPHGQSAWHCRTHPNVKAVFERIFGDAQLCCGMDCVFFSPNAAPVGANDTASGRLWPHADQNKHVKPSGKFEVYQGVLYVWPADADTSATVVWPRSHKALYEGLMQGSFRRHFCMLPKPAFGDFASNARRVPVPAGGLLLWNSRTIHQGWNGGARLAYPICYEPVHRRTRLALESKKECVYSGAPTTHWASLGEAHVLGNSAGEVSEIGGVALRHAGHLHCADERQRIRSDIFAVL